MLILLAFAALTAAAPQAQFGYNCVSDCASQQSIYPYAQQPLQYGAAPLVQETYDTSFQQYPYAQQPVSYGQQQPVQYLQQPQQVQYLQQPQPIQYPYAASQAVDQTYQLQGLVQQYQAQPAQQLSYQYVQQPQPQQAYYPYAQPQQPLVVQQQAQVVQAPVAQSPQYAFAEPNYLVQHSYRVFGPFNKCETEVVSGQQRPTGAPPKRGGCGRQRTTPAPPLPDQQPDKYRGDNTPYVYSDPHTQANLRGDKKRLRRFLRLKQDSDSSEE